MKPVDKRLTIRDWAEDDRPREKMLRNGSQALSDAELLAILIGSGNKTESAVELSRRILKEYNDNLNELAKMSIGELCKGFKGIGEAKAITIAAALEIGRRRKVKEMPERKIIRHSVDLWDIFEPVLQDLKHEEFWIVFLNASNRVIDMKRLNQGGLRKTVVDVTMLLRMALEKSAMSIAVAHNHPSGLLEPSREDEFITKNIKKGCDAIDIELVDHIIITEEGYYSFADKGKLISSI